MNRFHSGAVIAFAVLLSGSTSFGQNQASTAPPTNDAIVHHMEELEEQVKELRAEVAALKDNDKPATAATATASVTPVPQNNLVSSSHDWCGACCAIPSGTLGADVAERLRRSLLQPEFQQSGVSNEWSALLRSKHANVRFEHGGTGGRQDSRSHE